MKYLKLYESFNLPKYESDYKKIASFREEISKKDFELRDMKVRLNQMETKLNKDHNLSEMIQHIFDKISSHLMEEEGWDNKDEKNILEFLRETQSILTNGINGIYIEVYDADREDYIRELVDEIVYDGDKWCFRNFDNYGDPIYTSFDSQDTSTLYKILKTLMSESIVRLSLNKKLFRDINEGFVNSILISTLLSIGALRGYPQSDTLINKQIEQKIEMIDTDVNINDTINFIHNNDIILGRKYDLSMLDEKFYDQFNRNLLDAIPSLTKTSSPISIQVFTFDNESAGLIQVPIINIDLYPIKNLKISFFDSGWGDNYYNVFGVGITKKF